MDKADAERMKREGTSDKEGERSKKQETKREKKGGKRNGD